MGLRFGTRNLPLIRRSYARSISTYEAGDKTNRSVAARHSEIDHRNERRWNGSNIGTRRNSLDTGISAPGEILTCPQLR